MQAVVECTCFWYWLADWAAEHDIPLTLAHAKMVKAISYAKVKTDKVDAKTLAVLLRAGLIPEVYKVKPERRLPARDWGIGRLALWNATVWPPDDSGDSTRAGRLKIRDSLDSGRDSFRPLAEDKLRQLSEVWSAAAGQTTIAQTGRQQIVLNRTRFLKAARKTMGEDCLLDIFLF